MLPNYFLPEVDELPFSWMNRLALANGFKDTNDMLQSLGFIKGKAVKRQHDYLLKITKLMPKNDWTITLMKMYLAEDLQQESLYYRVTKYQLETLLSDNHLTVDNIAEVFRTTKYNEEMPVVAANIVCNSTMDSLTGYQKKNLLQLIFDDHPRYQRFLNNINYETMVGFEMKKLPNGHTVLHIKSANKYKARRERRRIKRVRNKIKRKQNRRR